MICNPIALLHNINSHAEFEENWLNNAQDQAPNQFSTQIKGNSSVLIWWNLPIYNPKPLFPNINFYTKFEDNQPKNAEDRAQKPIFYMNQGQ